jgi:hypothetical protein
MRSLVLGLIAIVSMLISGCGSNLGEPIAFATKTFGPDGRESYVINCGGLVRSWGNCYQKAGEICGARGYDTISEADDKGAIVAGNRSGTYGATSVQRTLVVACK